MQQKTKLIYSTFTSGLEHIISEFLRMKYKEKIEITQVLNGALIYKIAEGINITECKFFNNSFAVIDIVDYLDSSSRFHVAIKSAMNKINTIDCKIVNKKYFKIFFYDGGFINFASDAQNKLESLIQNKFGITNLKSAQSFNEFWFVKRTENIFLFLIRLTINSKRLDKGQLRPELSNLMCLLSQPNSSDVFLDPFAGSGALPMERANFPFSKIIIQDIASKAISQINSKLNNSKISKSNVLVQKENFLEMHFKKAFINKIVTDPPWGLYSKISDIEDFYLKIFKKFASILSLDGIIVILVSRDIDLSKLLFKFKTVFEIKGKYDILLSGKKSSIYKILKIS